jgi:Tfp pilus assembly protein PilE
MRRHNGFVFMERVVVVCVLSITLLILYASYAHILRMSREKKTFDTTDSIYTTYNVKKVIDTANTQSTFQGFFTSNTSFCKSIMGGNAYMCEMSKVSNSNGQLYQLKNIFDVDKFYYLSPNQILTNSNKSNWLLEIDATTIDYIQNLGVGVGANGKKILIVKYKHTHGDTYEVIHASMEV